jgi:putative ABC transport system permease protein
MQLWFTPKVPPDSPCTPGSCLANPPIQEIGALPSGTSAPNTVITEHAMRQLRFTATTAGWLIQAPGGLTATQITNATQTAAAAGASIETVNNIPSLTRITDVATIFGLVLALGILAMSIGLVRSETAGDLRTLTATGASGTARRTLTAATAGALALTGAVIGTAGAYLAAIGFFRTNQLDQLSELDSVPVAALLWILVGMPVIAVVVSWLLAGREPPAAGLLGLRTVRASYYRGWRHDRPGRCDGGRAERAGGRVDRDAPVPGAGAGRFGPDGPAVPHLEAGRGRR